MNVNVLPSDETIFDYSSTRRLHYYRRPSTQGGRDAKNKFQTSLKAQTLTRLLQDRESISSICEDLKISPVVLGQWSREVIGCLPLVFGKSLKKAER